LAPLRFQFFRVPPARLLHGCADVLKDLVARVLAEGAFHQPQRFAVTPGGHVLADGLGEAENRLLALNALLPLPLLLGLPLLDFGCQLLRQTGRPGVRRV
jgi:hypothetical protein